MKPLRPYLYNAYYDWIIESEATPYLLVNAEYLNVDVPQEFVKEGQIILNLSPHSIAQYCVDNEAISFNARFQGILRDLYIPFGAVIAIYTQETGEGVIFQEEEYYSEANYSARQSSKQAVKVTEKSKPKKNTKLKLVK
ncbi:ClpXP protease specificity-enhancing factor [Phocoenobacter skyensis]|uniref:ClpXP protease specificity-enhancing factor n=1 Tax=Phocoenobacter skyensis TaxID=97481 RepID=A0A1H7U495_9PAST|nr:ClpXP protease specificity-enhancing factor [Pasteurella skyensis]MDP8078734.1 ClpXP protease specificity-enhancing factor [Pasteurella skyensis]MDP8084729.1 ClpXP protease specificity-enhancing factor [Pasteurella skyensis]MDP8163113.1 ClpXP protease specificity-enhancing factor [Pasteurella skyensis]MDP8170201.1 ClpXP protease specificity-enhancing factor [Pasteurella skyensis]MDP8173066.1 ClpXP protease specificity-enhancing factor [Pasteurella skyensis]